MTDFFEIGVRDGQGHSVSHQEYFPFFCRLSFTIMNQLKSFVGLRLAHCQDGSAQAEICRILLKVLSET